MRALLYGAISLLLISSISKAESYALTVDRVTIDTRGFFKEGIGCNGGTPCPVLRFEEGEESQLTRSSAMKTDTKFVKKLFQSIQPSLTANCCS